MKELVPYLLKPLLLTELIELSAAACIKKNVKWFLPVSLANLITNPLLNLAVLLCFVKSGRVAWYVILIGEISVFVFETFFFRLITEDTLKHCAAMSLILNLLSYSLGLLF